MKGVFGLAPGANFPRLFVQGLLARCPADDPAALARVTVYLNTRRMQRAVEQELSAAGARLMPRLRLVTALADDYPLGLQPPVSSLRRKLEMMPLIAALFARDERPAAESAAFSLADSLASLMDEMHGEGVAPAAIARIDVADHAEHWQRAQRFLQIITQYFAADAAPDQQAFQRRLVENVIAGWQRNPPSHPIVIAGSTGSRGTTRMLMQAVAGLEQGTLVLPGYDFDAPPPVWAAIKDAMVGEDHPQFRFGKLQEGLDHRVVEPWVEHSAPIPARNRLISLSLRPAPITDQWMVEGPQLQDLDLAAAGMTLIEATSPRLEALAIALVMRDGLEKGKRVALICPDRNLTRRVTAVLAGWQLDPDDSAGEPLTLASTGRFLLMVASLYGQRVTGETLLALLKHPAVARGGDRGAHLRHTIRLELDIREKGLAFIDEAVLRGWASGHTDSELLTWADWLAGILPSFDCSGEQLLAVQLAQLRSDCEAFAKGPGGPDIGPLWVTSDGAVALGALGGLIADSDAAGEVTQPQFRDILTAVLAQQDVRKQGRYHPDLMIWGSREARILGADLVVLGGLNDGIWPSVASADPWLNRNMRMQAGLLLPERRIGLAAHDYQQAVCSAEVVLTRAKRDSQSETVSSRWLNRLTNLLTGLSDNGGPAALSAMKQRGEAWLDLAKEWDRPKAAEQPAPRPAPRPPVADRPKQLSVTAIRTLMRDPYAVYARHVLHLKVLPPLRPGPDPQLRGQVMHRILEVFLRNIPPDVDPRERLMSIADATLAEEVAWPTARALWRARLDRAADSFLNDIARTGGRPVMLEERKVLELPTVGFRLTARPDRIDVLPDGRLRIIDYKTGALPTEKQQKVYDVQLLLQACMAEKGAFGPDLPTDVASVAYIGLGADQKVAAVDITPDLTTRIWADLHRLLALYANPAQGYASRRALIKEADKGDYDHLARLGEWGMTDRATPEDVGGAG